MITDTSHNPCLPCRWGRHGLANIVVIILFALACIGIVTAYITAGQVIILEEKIKNQKDASKGYEVKRRQMINLMMNASPLIMPVAELATVEIPNVEKLLNDKRKSYKMEKIEDSTLENILRESINRLNISDIVVLRAQYEQSAAANRESKMKDFSGEIERIKDDELRRLKSRQMELNTLLSSETDKYVALTDKFNSEKKTLDERQPQLQSDFILKRTHMENEIALIKFNLDELVSKEVFNRDIVETQGRMINPDVRNQFAYISLGVPDNIKLGWKFMVFTREKSGQRRWKGQVEVKKIYDIQSLVSITALKDPMDPIVAGDLITNIFYHPTLPRAVVLIGKFERGDFKYDRTECERRLVDLNVKVDKTVTLKTDFVVVGKDPEETDLDRNNYYTVKKLNIPKLEGADARETMEFYLGD
ncbi:MAG: hypothetical protein HY762_02595 [Planctomycetes bacterium]|nr:hypothetical protein [Planctomycetota bacterium]